MRFLNKKLIDFIKIQQERQGADHAFSSPISTTEPRPIDILSAAPGMTAAEDLEIRSLESDLEPGESWHDPCDPALAEPRPIDISRVAPGITEEEHPETASLESDLEPGESWHDPCDSAFLNRPQ